MASIDARDEAAQVPLVVIACPTGAMASDFEANMEYVVDYHKRNGSVPTDRAWWFECQQKRISHNVMGKKHMATVEMAYGPVKAAILGGWKGAWPTGQEPQGLNFRYSH